MRRRRGTLVCGGVACRTTRARIALGCAAALLLATGAWWGERASQQDVPAALSPLLVEDQVTLRGVVLTDPERDGTAYRFQLGELQWESDDDWQPVCRPHSGYGAAQRRHDPYADPPPTSATATASPSPAAWSPRQSLTTLTTATTSPGRASAQWPATPSLTLEG